MNVLPPDRLTGDGWPKILMDDAQEVFVLGSGGAQLPP